MIFGLRAISNRHGNTSHVAACSRKQTFNLGPGPVTRDTLHRAWMLRSKIEPVKIWSFELERDLINFYGATMPDFLTLQFGRRKIVGATMRGAKVTFRDVTRFIVRKDGFEIGRMLRYPRLLIDPAKILDGQVASSDLARYCLRDAQIARKAGECIESELAACGVQL